MIYILQPANEEAYDDAYQNLHSLCSDVKWMDNGMVLVTTKHIKYLLEQYQKYTLVASPKVDF